MHGLRSIVNNGQEIKTLIIVNNSFMLVRLHQDKTITLQINSTAQTTFLHMCTLSMLNRNICQLL